MSFDEDDEILQDFLVEAGEILEDLSAELVQLENHPESEELLNAIFRGFHTIKGGAGFLQLQCMVECCHLAESVFDLLRNRQRQVSAELMDTILLALDAVNTMFDQLRGGEQLTPADAGVLQSLAILAQPEAPEAVVPVPQEVVEASETDSGAAGVETPGVETPGVESPAVEAAESSADVAGVAATETLQEGESDERVDVPVQPDGQSELITGDEFEDLLDQLQRDNRTVATLSTTAHSNTDEITEAEFEALQDELEGNKDSQAVATDQAVAAEKTASEVKAAADASSDEITEQEFDALLDELNTNKAKDDSEAKKIGPGKSSKPAAEQKHRDSDKAAEPPAPAKKPLRKSKEKALESTVSKVLQKDAKPKAKGSIRVETKRLDDIMNMVGELVLVRNRLVTLGLNSANEDMNKAVANLDLVTADLQAAVMKTRMQPIKKVFGRFPRVVRDLARNLNKEIHLELRGEETDLDKNLVEALADPLVHLVRNSVDHGIELPDKREAQGKPRTGTITLSAEQEGDHILLTIEDDGKGIDPAKLRRAAVSRGLLEQDKADRLTDAETYNLIFAPGFSTKEEISDLSGRGVGMDVVKTKISQLNGSVEVQSELGKGSLIRIKVPLTLAIMPTLMVMLGKQTFALPLVSVNEIYHLDLSKTNVVDGQEVMVVRDKPIPLYYLKRWLVKDCMEEQETIPTYSHVVIVSVGTRRVGFVVDRLIGQEEVVIKPLGKMLQGMPGMAGATITGDGTIALILDVPSMLKRYA